MVSLQRAHWQAPILSPGKGKQGLLVWMVAPTSAGLIGAQPRDMVGGGVSGGGGGGGGQSKPARLAAAGGARSQPSTMTGHIRACQSKGRPLSFLLERLRNKLAIWIQQTHSRRCK